MFGIKRRRLERQRQDALAAYDEAMSLAKAEYNTARKAYSDAKQHVRTKDMNEARRRMVVATNELLRLEMGR